MNQNLIACALAGKISPQMEKVAEAEGLDAQLICQRIADGQIVIPMNSGQSHRMVGIGKGLSTKINASIGTSTDIADIDAEVGKALAAQRAGADTLMELSVGGDLDKIRREVIAAVDLPVGNVPLYQAFCEAARRYGDPNKLGDLNWDGQFEQALFPVDAKKIRAERSPSGDRSVCTMCGDFCANKASSETFKEVLAAGGKA